MSSGGKYGAGRVVGVDLEILANREVDPTLHGVIETGDGTLSSEEWGDVPAAFGGFCPALRGLAVE